MNGSEHPTNSSGLRNISPAQLAVLSCVPTALEAIGRHLAAAAPAEAETGGILLGHDTRTQITITYAGGPGPAATHRPQHFRRDLVHARQLAAQVHAQTGARWVGEWHSHPSGPPSPSEVDIATYWRLLNDPDLHFTVLVALIASPASPNHARGSRSPGCGAVEVRAFLVDRQHAVAVDLHPDL